jgi:hypothetical protein
MTRAGVDPSGCREPASPFTFRVGAFHPTPRDRTGTKLGRPSRALFPFWEGSGGQPVPHRIAAESTGAVQVAEAAGGRKRVRRGRWTSTLPDRLDLNFQVEPAPRPICGQSWDSTLPRQRETGTISQRKPFSLRRRDQRRRNHRLLG